MNGGSVCELPRNLTDTDFGGQRNVMVIGIGERGGEPASAGALARSVRITNLCDAVAGEHERPCDGDRNELRAVFLTCQLHCLLQSAPGGG